MQPFPVDDITRAQIDKLTVAFAHEEDLDGFEAIHGYLSMVHLSPIPLQISRWMPVIVGDYKWPDEKAEKEATDLLKKLHDAIGKHIATVGLSLPATVQIDKNDPAANLKNEKLTGWVMGILNGIGLLDPLLEEIFNTEDPDLLEAEEAIDQSILAIQLMVDAPECREILEEAEGGAEALLKEIVDEFEDILDELDEVMLFVRENYNGTAE